MLFTLTAENDLKEESACGLWSSIFISAVKSADSPNKDEGNARHTSKKVFLAIHGEMSESSQV